MSHNIQTDKPSYADSPRDVSARDMIRQFDVPSWGDVLDTVTELEYQPTFIETLQQNGVDPTDRAAPDYALMLSLYGESYVKDSGDTLSELEAMMVSLAASMPSVLHAQHEIADYKDLRDNVRDLTPEERSYQRDMLKPTTIWYNKKLADYIALSGAERFDDLTHALTEASLDFFPGSEHVTAEEVFQLARGARNEASADVLRVALPEFFRETTIAEDAKSADQMLMYKGREYNVDFKSSPFEIKKQRLEQLRIAGASHQEIAKVIDNIKAKNLMYAVKHNSGNQAPTITLYTGIEDEDYLGYNQLRQETLDQKSFMMQIQLQRALVDLGA